MQRHLLVNSYNIRLWIELHLRALTDAILQRDLRLANFFLKSTEQVTVKDLV